MSFKFNVTTVLLFVFAMPLVSWAGGLQGNPAFDSFIQPQPRMIRDPFSPSKRMFDAVGQQSGNTAGGFGFMRSPNASVPKMRLRGFIDLDNKDPIALLEVGGNRTFIVHEGDEINIDPTQPMSVIRITKITRLSITVETGRLGSIRVQR